MLGYLAAGQPVETGQPLDDALPDGFVERALRLLGRTTSAPGQVPPPKSRRDFIRALRILGAKSSRFRLGSDDPLPRTVPLHISCPYRTWLKVFGRPRRLENHGKPSGRIAIHLWRHECEDGPITCIGQVSERLPGLRWVVVMRVGLY
jgi:hypothetical protein